MRSIFRAVGRVWAALVMSAFIALMRYVLCSITRSQSQGRRGEEVLPSLRNRSHWSGERYYSSSAKPVGQEVTEALLYERK
jgi:hypothetical protein